MNAAGTGAAHTPGARTVYFNEAAAMANMAEGDKMYPAGSMIIKEVYGEDEMADQVVHVASMTKTDDPMYAERGGWIYGVGGNNLAIADSVGCDECHAKAGDGNDYVFVSLTKDDDMDDTDMDDTDMDDTDMDDTDMDDTDMDDTDMDDSDMDDTDMDDSDMDDTDMDDTDMDDSDNGAGNGNGNGNGNGA
ncbi:hypothetical protein C6497_04050 [Candidatus Poribacteria bacterium]|nr:MAG: hypothetical protein C6497_04050 [Candidatus Poribacteria bacterium]